MGRNRKTNMTPGELAHFRNHVWYHNSLRGRVRSALSATSAVACSPSATAPAQLLASQITTMLDELDRMLKAERVDYVTG